MKKMKSVMVFLWILSFGNAYANGPVDQQNYDSPIQVEAFLLSIAGSELYHKLSAKVLATGTGYKSIKIINAPEKAISSGGGYGFGYATCLTSYTVHFEQIDGSIGSLKGKTNLPCRP